MGNSKSQPKRRSVPTSKPKISITRDNRDIAKFFINENEESEESVEGSAKIKKASSNRSLANNSTGSDTLPLAKQTRSASISSQGSRGVKQPLSVNSRSIIKSSMDNAKEDVAERIFRRVVEKRDDLKILIGNIGKEAWMDVVDALKDYLKAVVESLTDAEELQRISEDFGGSHVVLRSFGFKPDCFAAIADAVTTEGVILDAAAHQPTDVTMAWSQLTAFLFSSVRNGYYTEVRRIRKELSSYRARAKVSVDSEKTTETASTYSTSPNHDSIADDQSAVEDTVEESSSAAAMVAESVESSSMDFLQPPPTVHG